VIGWRPDDLRLLALVAVFAPARAGPLLSRLGVHDAEPLRTEGSRLAAATRRVRLLALAAAIPQPGPSHSELSAAIAAAERPRPAAALRVALPADGSGPKLDALRPALRRLLGERLQAATG
jgi:hypothetical protein